MSRSIASILERLNAREVYLSPEHKRTSMREYTCRDFYLNMLGTHVGSDLAREVKMRESHLEKYIKDYTYDKTGEPVYLRLENAISISHVSKKGSTTLAILWANVLQHPENFPSERFEYRRMTSGRLGDRLLLSAEKISFTVIMATGSLRLEGPHIYDWFTRRFRTLLDNFDASYQKTWMYIPTPDIKVAPEEDKNPILDDPNTATEDYLLLRTRSHAVGTSLDRRMEEHAEDYISGLGNMALDQPVFEGEELDVETSSLVHGAVRDGMTYIHKLWFSLLNKWFSCPDTKVYLAMPELTESRLEELADISIKNQYQGQLEVLYTNPVCDPTTGQRVEQVKATTLKKYDQKHHTYLEYRVLHRIFLPLKRVGARFAAGVGPDGQATILLTSANFLAPSSTQEALHTVTVLTMDKESFLEHYVTPLGSPVIAAVY